jgi:hypothetical protein
VRTDSRMRQALAGAACRQQTTRTSNRMQRESDHWRASSLLVGRCIQSTELAVIGMGQTPARVVLWPLLTALCHGTHRSGAPQVYLRFSAAQFQARDAMWDDHASASKGRRTFGQLCNESTRMVVRWSVSRGGGQNDSSLADFGSSRAPDFSSGASIACVFIVADLLIWGRVKDSFRGLDAPLASSMLTVLPKVGGPSPDGPERIFCRAKSDFVPLKLRPFDCSSLRRDDASPLESQRGDGGSGSFETPTHISGGLSTNPREWLNRAKCS